ncbi:flagellar motor protein PomA [Marinobacter sp. JSM 1782161]|uniref:flagellar motor protein PomA n=1 Tax=Marinobacter sp. JSM 1782161 TaxID=2685906 RepID=UPI0014026E84|nr:flagellar motor protein PomA [Marinobacter sp. JSM 1782161]
MDFATLFGLVGATLVIGSAIVLGASSQVFLNMPSVLIVLVGSFCVVMAKFSFGQFLGAFKAASRAFSFKLPDTEALINEVVDIANVARKQGVLALEEKEVSATFLRQGIQFLLESQPAETIEKLMQKERLLTLDRNRMGAKVFRALADVGPAMGMIGTIVGLVQMLSNMEDPKSIGPAMAVALLTTLYGAILATMFASPIADKLELRMTEEARMQALIIDAVIAIQEGRNPRVIEQMLSSYLPPSKREQNGEAETAS